jgi:Zn-dependent alcohol dehydrogenase
MEKGIVDPNKIITHRFKLEDINKAMNTMNNSDRIKIIINP